MQVRVFESTDMASGLKKIKEELGPDALILSTRTVKNGKLGVMGKSMLEITAAIDDNPPAASPPHSPAQKFITKNKRSFFTAGHPAEPQSRHTSGSGFSHVVNDDPENYVQPHSNYAKESTVQPDKQGRTETEKHNDTLEQEVRELKSIVTGLSGKIEDLLSSQETSGQKNVSTQQAQRQLTMFNSTVSPAKSNLKGDFILSFLAQKGIDVETTRILGDFLRQSLTPEELVNNALVRQTITETIETLIEVAPPDFSDQQKQHRIALAGPTGVGKTTTIAKICASFISKYHANSVALITVDTYRIAAVEQLKIYGDIMNVPVDVVITPAQLQEALTRHSDKQLLLIDTAGRSPRDNLQIDELANYFTPELGIDCHLVLSAATRESELREIINRFQPLDFNNTVFTKIDECSNLGILLNTQLQNPTPLSYITNGQRVPEDLVELTPRKVAELIIDQVDGASHE